jgi:hypothetical protein
MSGSGYLLWSYDLFEEIVIFPSDPLLVESKWCDYVMVEADSHLKLLPKSILEIYKVFEHIDMPSIGMQYQPYTVTPTQLGSDSGFWVTCGVKMI